MLCWHSGGAPLSTSVERVRKVAYVGVKVVATMWLAFIAFVAGVLGWMSFLHAPYLPARGFTAGALFCAVGAVMLWWSAPPHWVSLAAVGVSLLLVFIFGRVGP